ncbi:MAG: barstar family protein [Rhizomicrobium sp.]
MQVIELDGANWAAATDFYDALLAALGAPRWHGQSVDALIDSMIYGGVNAIEPPYIVRVKGIGKVPTEVQTEVELASKYLAQARQDYRASRGQDIEVQLEIDG